MREPLVAGQFYPENPKELKRMIKECFLSEFGPGRLPKEKGKNIIGGIVPHAGYMYSGPCAAHLYKEITGKERFIILGVSHRGYNGICTTLEDFKTPLGIAQLDKGLAESLIKSNLIEDNKLVHEAEHSIEVQLPFLQFVLGNKFKFVPIIIGKYDGRIAKLLSQHDVCVLASSDLTHFGYSYGYTPFTKDKKENLYKLDNSAIEIIKELNSKKFLDFCKDKTICGSLPISILLDYAKLKKAKAHLLKYYTSGDILNDYESAVGYASIALL